MEILIISLDGSKFNKAWRLPAEQNYPPPVSSTINCLSQKITWMGPSHSGIHPSKNVTKSGIILGAQSHLNPNQELKGRFAEEGRSIIPILQTNAYRWIKQHFHGNPCKFMIDLYL